MKKQNQRHIYGVLGLGRFGSSVARELAISGADVLAIDCDENKVRAARKYTENAFVSESLDEETLREIGFGECSTVIVCIGEKIDTSLLAALTLLNLGVKHVIAKASSTEHGMLLEKIGAEVIYPERDMGIALARRLESRGILESINLASDVDIAECALPARYAGKTIAESAIRSRFGLNIIAIRRGDKTIISLNPNETFCADDTLLLIGSNDALHRFLAESAK